MNYFNSIQKPHWLLLPLFSVLLSLPFYHLAPGAYFVAFAPLMYFAIGMPERTIPKLYRRSYRGSISFFRIRFSRNSTGLGDIP